MSLKLEIRLLYIDQPSDVSTTVQFIRFLSKNIIYWTWEPIQITNHSL